MAANKTCLSAGIVINDILRSDETVKNIVTDVFPVMSTEAALLPYVVYRRTQKNTEPVKTGRPADTTYVEVICFAKSYGESINLAEAVRAALDGKEYSKNGLNMRHCMMTDSEEGYDSDAYLQQLVFEIRM